jgi:hypothetical protein
MHITDAAITQAVHTAAERYSAEHQAHERPSDAEEAAALYHEALLAGCASVFGGRLALTAYAQFASPSTRRADSIDEVADRDQQTAAELGVDSISCRRSPLPAADVPCPCSCPPDACVMDVLATNNERLRTS